MLTYLAMPVAILLLMIAMIGASRWAEHTTRGGLESVESTEVRTELETILRGERLSRFIPWLGIPVCIGVLLFRLIKIAL